MPTVEEKIDELLRLVRAMQPGAPAAATSGNGKWEAGGGVADEALLSGPYGNPKVFKTEPKEWTGPSQVGIAASEVPYLYGFAYADMMDRFGDKAKREGQTDKNGKATYWRKYQEAACFRAWAQRNEKLAADPF